MAAKPIEELMKVQPELASVLERHVRLLRGESLTAARLAKDADAVVARAKQRVEEALRQRDQVTRLADERVDKAKQELKELEKRAQLLEKATRKGAKE